MLNYIFSAGTVTEVNSKDSIAKVALDIDLELQPIEMIVIQSSSLKNRSYRMPMVNERVVCLTADDFSVGFILGSIYDEDNKPPTTDEGLFVKLFQDGSRVEFDTKNGNLTADIKGSADIKIGKDLTAEIEGDAKIKASKVLIESDDITLGGAGALKLVNELHTCFFTGSLHNVSTTQKVKGA